MKKISVIFCIVFVFLVLPMSVYGQLKIWSYTDELANIIKIYNKSYPEIKIDYSQSDVDSFQERIDQVLQNKDFFLKRIDPVLLTSGAPDIITLEESFVRKYVESGLLLDLTDIYEANKSKLLAYPVQIGTYNGKVYAMSWQAYPGAMFYRRSLARKYLGTDDPKTVQSYFTDFDKFFETARFLDQKSKGSCLIVSSLNDLRNPFLAARKNPWIVNGKLVIDPVMTQYMDICKTLHDNGFEGGVEQWSEIWFNGMIGEFRDEKRNPKEVFSYFFPSWGLHYVLKTNAFNTAGDWAMIQGPFPYFWGGTWIGAYKGTKNVAEVKEFIRYVTTNDDFLETWAKDTGDMVSSINVINKIKDNFSEPYLGGQNNYAEFAEIAKSVNGKLWQTTDGAIQDMFEEAVTAFVNGKKTKDQALADFKRQVEAQFIR